MKSLLRFVALAVLATALLAGCAAPEGQQYTPSQVAAQHASYDPTPHSYGTYY